MLASALKDNGTKGWVENYRTASVHSIHSNDSRIEVYRIGKTHTHVPPEIGTAHIQQGHSDVHHGPLYKNIDFRDALQSTTTGPRTKLVSEE